MSIGAKTMLPLPMMPLTLKKCLLAQVGRVPSTYDRPRILSEKDNEGGI
jgi:hypothetical protein